MRTSTRALLSVAVLVGMGAAEAPAMSLRAGCTARPTAVSRVSAPSGARAVGQIGCCDGQIRCSQFLATTIVVRPQPSHRS